MPVRVNDPVVPVSTADAPFMVVTSEVYAPAVEVLVSPLTLIETAVPTATWAAVNE